MKFLKQPCADCPFRLDQNYALHPERVAEIGAALANDGSFACHKEIARVRRQTLERLHAEEEHGNIDGDEITEGELAMLACSTGIEALVEPAAFCGGALHYMQHHDLLLANRITRWGIRCERLPYPLPEPVAPITADIAHLSRLPTVRATRKERP